MDKLEGRVAAITGGGSGIGRALAEQLAPLGCHLALIDIDQGRLDEVAGACTRNGLTITTHVADVRDRDRMKALADEVVEAHGGVQILVNNAGVTAWGSFEEMSFEDLDWVLDVNLGGVINGCKFFLPYLRKEAEAHIVNVSSLFGILGACNQAAYCMSKYAVRALTEVLDAELDESSINVSVIHPGGVSTNFVTDSRSADLESKKQFADLVDQHMIKPDKVAAKIITAIKKNKLRARVGPDAFVGDWVKRAFPTGGQRGLARFLKKSMP
jgi:NAD(P)-dependent dehydrogenase (short-subunit alcohol dehydrogenase family)